MGHAKPYLAMRMLGVIIAVLIATPAMAIPFDFGVSTSVTVIAYQRVSIGAAIINRSDTSIDFGCALVECGGLDFGAGLAAGPGEGLDALNFSFGSFYSQFVDLVLAPDERFDFTFGTIDFDPSITDKTVSVSVLHPIFQFRIGHGPEEEFASLPATISVGDHVEFGPITFVHSSPTPPVPEPSSLSLLAMGLLGMVAFAARRRALLARR